MALFPVAGAKIYIGGQMDEQSADFVASDFASQVWTEIKKWTQMGSIGDKATLITALLIAEGREKKAKGTKNAGSMQNIFAIEPLDPGQQALIAAVASAQNYAFKIAFADTPAVRSSVATVTIASPGVVTWTSHGLVAGEAVSFSTTGALPTGLVAATTYYVKTVLDANTFTLAATSGGTVIATTGTQSGVHTISTVPSPGTVNFIALVMNANEAGGAANTVRNIDSTVEINSNIVYTPATE